MKHFLVLSIISASLLISTLEAKKPYMDIHLGAASFENSYERYKEETGSSYTIGFGLTKVFDNNVFLGIDYDLEYLDFSQEEPLYDNSWTTGMDLKLGYEYKDISLYGIGGLRIIGDQEDFYGFGYGIGLGYRFSEHIGMDLEYKTYDLQGTYIEYDYTTVGAGIKYIF